MHTQTIHQHRDQVPLMNEITASPHSVVTISDLNLARFQQQEDLSA